MHFFIWQTLKPALEITILWVVFYRILVFFEGTRSFQVLKGLSYLLLAFLASQIFGFDTVNWILTKFFAISIIALLIIFQQELRLGLARLGQQHLFTVALEESEIMALIEELTTAIYKMSKNKIGCIIALEREDKLTTYIQSGIPLEGKVSSELLQTIFTPPAPLHDGGVVICGDKIASAACLFPLSENPNFSKLIGTRHRAALGLTEQTDAIVVMVSEETTEISIAADGKFIPVVNRDRFIALLKDFLAADPKDTKKGKGVNPSS